MAKSARSQPELLSAEALANQVDEPYNTVDHWAKFGLLVYAKRGRKRLFEKKENVQRCQRIRELQQKDHSLATIRGIFNGEIE